jgi:lysozyme
MEAGKLALDEIKYWERNLKTGTFYDRAYQDSEGVWTIGWGTIRWDMKTPVREGNTITEDEADRQLRKECQRIEDALNSSVKVPLTQPQFDALISLFYNIGIGWCTGIGHKQATFIKNLNKGNYLGVPAGMLQFTRGAISGKHYNGLLNRRKREVKIWLTDPDNDIVPLPETVAVPAEGTVPEPMPQAVTEDRPTILKTAKDSKTVKWGVGAFATWLATQITNAYDWLFGIVKEAGPEIVSLKTQLSPFDALIKMTPTILVGLTAFCIIGVIAQRISDRGKPR